MVRYENTPAATTLRTPLDWPQNANIARDPQRATLVVLLHPYCSCSRATLTELSILMAHSHGLVTTYALFVRPPGASPSWVHSALWDRAASIPDVTVSEDTSGHDAHLFGATASGDVLLYDRNGRLLFTGGITDGRGHEGDNTGLSDVLDLLRGRQAASLRTNVYGCSLSSTTRPAEKGAP